MKDNIKIVSCSYVVTDNEDGYVTEYEYSPVNLVSSINYNDAKTVSYLYNGTGELVEMEDWNGKMTTYVYDASVNG